MRWSIGIVITRLLRAGCGGLLITRLKAPRSKAAMVESSILLWRTAAYGILSCSVSYFKNTVIKRRVL
jgi:hypothetical protein